MFGKRSVTICAGALKIGYQVTSPDLQEAWEPNGKSLNPDINWIQTHTSMEAPEVTIQNGTTGLGKNHA